MSAMNALAHLVESFVPLDARYTGTVGRRDWSPRKPWESSRARVIFALVVSCAVAIVSVSVVGPARGQTCRRLTGPLGVGAFAQAGQGAAGTPDHEALAVGSSAPRPHRVYLIPGQGADGRLFSRLDLDGYDTVVLEFLLPERRETLEHYALRMAERIDRSRPFSLIGVSFGGMIAVEISRVLEAERVILVSSAACRKALPVRYRVMKYLPLYRLFPGWLLKQLALVAQPLFEPASKAQRETFRAMIRAKDPRFMQRSIHCIVTWGLEEAPEGIVHIHGDRDHTLPLRRIRRVEEPVVVRGGSHMMILVRGPELSTLIRRFLP